MKPRIFISSTYYDLKYVRENLLRFIESRYEFNAVLFERGNIPYEHDKSISESCYMEVNRCNMMILIIGGRYGYTDMSDTDSHVSITKREFETAVKRNIPIFIFIDKNVYLEYKIYKNNNISEYKPSYIDNIKVFDFIDEVKGHPIKTFEKIEDIEKYLSEQWGGWFYNYLEGLGNNVYKDLNDKLTNTFEVVEKLKRIVDAMAKETLKEEQIEIIRDNEIKMDIKYYATRVLYCIVFENFKLDETGLANSFGELFFKYFYKNSEIENRLKDASPNRFSYFEQLIQNFNLELKKISDTIVVQTIDFSKMFQGNEKLIEEIRIEHNSKYFIECFSKEIQDLGEE